jgi:hypothetical protein
MPTQVAAATACRHRIGPELAALALSESIDLTTFLNYAVKVGCGWISYLTGCRGQPLAGTGLCSL